MAKKRMPIYGIWAPWRPILAHNLAKYQYFPIKPTLFDRYHQFNYSVQVWGHYLLK